MRLCVKNQDLAIIETLFSTYAFFLDEQAKKQTELIEELDAPLNQVEIFTPQLNYIGVSHKLKLIIDYQNPFSDPYVTPILAQRFVDTAEFLTKIANIVEPFKGLKILALKVFILRNGAIQAKFSGALLKEIITVLFFKHGFFIRRRRFLRNRFHKVIFLKRSRMLHINEIFKLLIFLNTFGKCEFKSLVGRLRTHRVFVVF
jgi:hypothetical protein